MPKDSVMPIPDVTTTTVVRGSGRSSTRLVAALSA